MSKLLDYINTLDKDAQARAAHKANPATSMTNAGLTTAEQDAVLSGDRQRLADALGVPAHNLPAIQIPEGTF